MKYHVEVDTDDSDADEDLEREVKTSSKAGKKYKLFCWTLPIKHGTWIICAMDACACMWLSATLFAIKLNEFYECLWVFATIKILSTFLQTIVNPISCLGSGDPRAGYQWKGEVQQARHQERALGSSGWCSGVWLRFPEECRESNGCSGASFQTYSHIKSSIVSTRVYKTCARMHL